MKIALFVPCYIDAFFPEVGIATLELLERLGCEVAYPFDQTCCGQPMANSGCNAESAATERLFVRNFAGFEYVVCPSASCVHHVRDKFDAIAQTDTVRQVRAATIELVDFLHDVLRVDAFPWAHFPHRVGLHTSCTALRALNHASTSEIHQPAFSKPRALLARVRGIEFVTPERPDECCGFGGLYSVTEDAVSAKMGYDKVADMGRAGAAYVVSGDTSCLMHQQGCADRMGRQDGAEQGGADRRGAGLKFLHIAQVLNGAAA